MLTTSDSPIIHPALGNSFSPEDEALQRKLTARFDIVPLVLGGVGLLALMYLLESIVSPFIVIVALYMLLTPFREYRAARTMMWTAGFLFFFWFLFTLAGLLVPFILGALMAYLFDPLITNLEIKRRIPRVYSSLGLILIFVLLFGLLGWYSFPHLALQAENIFNKISDFLNRHKNSLDYENLKAILISIGLPADVSEQLVTSEIGPQIKKLFAAVPGFIFGYVQGLPQFVERTLNLLIIFPISAFYFMKDWPKIGPLFLQFLPAKDRERRAKMFSNIDKVVYSYVRGQLMMATMVGVLGAIIYSIMGVPYAGLLGVMLGITDLIPIVGLIFSGAIIVTVLSLTPPVDVGMIIGALLVIFGLHALEVYIVGPKFVGEQIGIPPVVMILSLFIFGYFMGFLGLLIAVPATAVILLFIEEYRKLQNDLPSPVPTPNITVSS